MDHQLLRLHAEPLGDRSADPVRFLLMQHDRIERNEHQFDVSRFGLQNHAGGEHRPVNAFGDVMGRASPQAGVDSRRWSYDLPRQADAAAKLGMNKAPGCRFGAHSPVYVVDGAASEETVRAAGTAIASAAR